MSLILLGASESACGILRSALHKTVPGARVEREETAEGLLERAKTLRPDAVVVEESCLGEDRRRFLGSMKGICEDVPVVIIGTEDSRAVCRIETAIANALGMTPPEPVSEAVPDLEQKTETHRVRNRLAGLVVSIRALGADLDAAAGDSDEVRRIVVDYKARLGLILDDIRRDPNSLPNRESEP